MWSDHPIMHGSVDARLCTLEIARLPASNCTNLEPKIWERNATGEATYYMRRVYVCRKRCLSRGSSLSDSDAKLLIHSRAQVTYPRPHPGRASTGTPLEHGCASPSFGSPEHGWTNPGARARGNGCPLRVTQHFCAFARSPCRSHVTCSQDEDFW